MYGVDSTRYAAGKTLLAMMIAVLMTGDVVAACSVSGLDEKELEKQMVTEFMKGSSITIFDNVEFELRWAPLNTLLTGAAVDQRLLGQNRQVRLQNSGLIIANGNNLRLGEDLTRRTLVAKLAPKVEKPYLVKHTFDPIEQIKSYRSEYLMCCYGILRAYIQAGCPYPTDRTPLAGFAEWDRLICGAMLWVSDGKYDPRRAIDRLEADQAALSGKAALKRAWRAQLQGKKVTAQELLALGDSPLGRALRELVGAKSFPDITTKSLGTALRDLRSVDGGLILRREEITSRENKGALRWWVEECASEEGSAEDGERAGSVGS
jgi:hypothetical protein